MFKKRFHLSKFKTILLGYLFVIVMGAFLLSLPISSASKTWTSFIDSIFTSTSAVCVTGLVVFDTATHWSIFGQIVILLLIPTKRFKILSYYFHLCQFKARRG